MVHTVRVLAEETPKSAVLLAFLCSFLIGAAQLTIKWGADRFRNYGWSDPPAFMSLLLAYSMFGIGFLIFLRALRCGELSTIYPVLAARYIWVVAVTPLLFSTESLNLYKMAGVGLAAVGVAIVARVGSR